MSFHHVAYTVVKSGFVIDDTREDYGYDGYVEFYSDTGEVETGNVFIQLKATDDIGRYTTEKGISYPVDMRDFDLWADNPYPVYFILFDAGTETAYWLYFQKYVQENGLKSASILTDTLTVHLDPHVRVEASTAKAWQDDKNRALAQMQRINHV